MCGQTQRPKHTHSPTNVSDLIKCLILTESKTFMEKPTRSTTPTQRSIVPREKAKQFINKARNFGYSWAEIAGVLGLSRERTIQLAGRKIGSSERKQALIEHGGQCRVCGTTDGQICVSREQGRLVVTCKPCFNKLSHHHMYEASKKRKKDGLTSLRKAATTILGKV